MKNLFTVVFFTVAAMVILMISASEAAPKKKVYIKDISAGSGAGSAARRVQDNIVIFILGNYGGRYQVIGDDDLKTIFEKTEELQAVGGNSDAALKQIANALNADEIITGDVTFENGKYSLRLQNLERNDATSEIAKKSAVSIVFLENQIEYFSREAVRKLIDPRYAIDQTRAPVAISHLFDIEKIEQKGSMGFELAKIERNRSAEAMGKVKLDAEDSMAEQVIDYFRDLLKEGDALYDAGKMPEARAKYTEIDSKSMTKLGPETRQKIAPFLKEVTTRIEAALANEILNDVRIGDAKFKSGNYDAAVQLYLSAETRMMNSGLDRNSAAIIKIDKVLTSRFVMVNRDRFAAKLTEADKEIKAKVSPSYRELEKAEKRYTLISDDFRRLKQEYQSPEINSAITLRLAEIRLARALMKEDGADRDVEGLKFTKALEGYGAAADILQNVVATGKKYRDAHQRISDKKTYAQSTGYAWMDNKVTIACNRSEYLNLRGNTLEAQKVLKRTEVFIGLNRPLFTDQMRKRFDEVSAGTGYLSTLNQTVNDVDQYASYRSSHLARNAGKYAIGSYSASAALLGIGIYYFTQLNHVNSQYDSLYERYTAASTVSDAAALHEKLSRKHNLAARYTDYANITFAAGGLALVSAMYFTYEYFFYRNMRREIEKSEGGYSFDFNLAPQRITQCDAFRSGSELHASFTSTYHF